MTIRSVLILVVVGALLFTFWAIGGFTAAYVRDNVGNTQVLWSRDRALVLASVRRNGWSGTYAAFLREILAGVFGRPPRFSESRQWVVATVMTGDGVHSEVEEIRQFGFAHVHDDTVYVFAGGWLLRWDGARFQRVPDEEQARIIAAIGVAGARYLDVDGWSSRTGLLDAVEPRVEMSVPLAWGTIVVVGERSSGRPRLARISVERVGEPPIEVLSVDERIRWVSWREHQRLMDADSFR
jgi:hypothetical protein